MSGPRLAYAGRRHVAIQPGAPALRTHHLTVRYPGSSAAALDGLDAEVLPGRRVALVGPNGSGKSTLLRAACGLVRPDSGQIAVYGNDVRACHHRVAFLAQRADVDWRFPITVGGLVLTGRYVHVGWLGRPGPADHAMVAATLERLGIAELADRQISNLSGGQQQRALLARALVQQADLLLLDEPMNAVDARTREVFDDVLFDLAEEGRAIVVATHDLGEMDAPYDDVIYLAAGRRVSRSGSAPHAA